MVNKHRTCKYQVRVILISHFLDCLCFKTLDPSPYLTCSWRLFSWFLDKKKNRVLVYCHVICPDFHLTGLRHGRLALIARRFWVPISAGAFVCGVYTSSLCLHWFSLGTPASSHSPMTYLLGELIPLDHRCECAWLFVSVGPVTDWRPVQGVPLSAIARWDRLQAPGPSDPIGQGSVEDRWMVYGI